MTMTMEFERIRGVKAAPLPEMYTSGHRTCQGCDSALNCRYVAKAAGPRSIALGATGCMYVANTSYYSTPWAIPWMHTQLGATGSAVLGVSASLKVQMRKGKIKNEPINVIGIGGDGGIADMGLSAVSATLTWPEYNSLIVMYDNESYANTGIQVSCQTPYGAHTTFSPVGTVKRIMHKRWKKNTAAMLAAGHPECRYVASACTAYPIDLMNKVRRALSIGGPTFVAILCPCPKGWDFDPRYSHEMGEMACKSGMWANWEMEDGKLTFQTPSSGIIKGMVKRTPVTEYLQRQGRFDHLTKEDFDHIQKQLDKIWGDWGIPAILPFKVAEGELA